MSKLLNAIDQLKFEIDFVTKTTLAIADDIQKAIMVNPGPWNEQKSLSLEHILIVLLFPTYKQLERGTDWLIVCLFQWHK